MRNQSENETERDKCVQSDRISVNISEEAKTFSKYAQLSDETLVKDLGDMIDDSDRDLSFLIMNLMNWQAIHAFLNLQ